MLGIKKLGFTMIELLVVIAVIGILAVALLATLNPLEQIRKGRDTGRRADASQLASALERFNASIGYFPWEGEEGNSQAVAWADLTGTAALRADDDDCPGACLPLEVLQELEDTSEVKTSFIGKVTTGNPIFLTYGAGTGSSIYVCFTPESNTFSREAFDRCAASDFGSDFTGEATACPDTAYTDPFDPDDANEMICIP